MVVRRVVVVVAKNWGDLDHRIGKLRRQNDFKKDFR